MPRPPSACGRLSVCQATLALLSLEPLAGSVSLGLDEPEEPVIVRGDRVSLREALSNLIHNALRHGARDSLDVTVRRDGGQVVVEIGDLQ